jgi:hypothetical protein
MITGQWRDFHARIENRLQGFADDRLGRGDSEALEKRAWIDSERVERILRY